MHRLEVPERSHAQSIEIAFRQGAPAEAGIGLPLAAQREVLGELELHAQTVGQAVGRFFRAAERAAAASCPHAGATAAKTPVITAGKSNLLAFIVRPLAGCLARTYRAG